MMGKFRRVVECRSQSDATGNEKWVYRLECGQTGEKLKRTRNSRRDRPAPIRVKCKCPKCV